MFELVLFIAIGLVAVVAAIGVIAQRNVLYSGLLLVLNFLCLAALYILMNAAFVGVVQIIVYAGALMVMFLFTVMLLSGKRTDQVAGGLPGQAPLAVLFVVVLGLELFLLLRGGLHVTPAPLESLRDPLSVEGLAQVLFTRYLWALEATGLLLLVAVVGVVYLVKGKPGAGDRR